MQAGKLPPELLSKLLGKIDIKNPRVFLGSRLGEDAALVDFGDRYLVAKTDPVTFATDLIGQYVVQVNANDLAVMGATPRWLMVTLLFPEKTPIETVNSIFDQLLEACGDLDIDLIGGHTEFTYDLPRPIAIGAMLGEVDKDKVILTSGARPGDAIVLTKGIAIEGTAILAQEKERELKKTGVPSPVVESAKGLLFEPGISVVRDAVIACDVVAIHSMHDPTEGGLASGLLELAKAAGVGLEVDAKLIPVLPECRAFCQTLGLDPMGLIASGALMATVAQEDASKLIDALEQDGIPAFEIGFVTDPQKGVKMRTKNGLQELPVFDRDELLRVVT